MVIKAKNLFTIEEEKRITETIKNIEKKTIGEVAVMVVDCSDQYPEAEIIGSIFISSLVSLIVTILFFHQNMWAFIFFCIFLFFPMIYIFKKSPTFKALFLNPHRIEECVYERAVKGFYEKRLFKTKMHTGVLFFISLLEKKVWVLADEGIYNKIQQESLNKYAQRVAEGIKNNKACEALCSSIEEIGEILSEYFPYKTGDINELPDRVFYESEIKE